MNWSVYIILCSDDSFYTGITNNISRRFHQHAVQRGAKYFRGRQPIRLIYVEPGHDRSTASKRESVIKKMGRPDKLRLLASESNKIAESPSVCNCEGI